MISRFDILHCIMCIMCTVILINSNFRLPSSETRTIAFTLTFDYSKSKFSSFLKIIIRVFCSLIIWFTVIIVFIVPLVERRLEVYFCWFLDFRNLLETNNPVYLSPFTLTINFVKFEWIKFTRKPSILVVECGWLVDRVNLIGTSGNRLIKRTLIH